MQVHERSCATGVPEDEGRRSPAGAGGRPRTFLSLQTSTSPWSLEKGYEMQVGQSTMQLMQILNFGPEDLEYNKHGQLSPAQREMMQIRKEAAVATGRRATKGTPFVLLYFIVVLGVIGALFVATGSFRPVQNALGGLTIPVLGGVVLVLLLIVATVPRSYRRSVERYRQMAEAMPVVYPVRYLEGTIKLKTRNVSVGGSPEDSGVYITSYYLTLGGKDFQVDQQKYNAVKQVIDKRDKYKLYFADTGKSGGIILSIAPSGANS